MFKPNEGVLDRILRVASGLLIVPVGLIWYGLQGSLIGSVMAGFGVLLLITGFTGVCPLYIPFRFSTLEKEKEQFAKCKSKMNSFCQGPDISGHSTMIQL